MFCNKCGNEVSPNQEFCNKCGNHLAYNNVNNQKQNKDAKINKTGIIVPIIITIMIIVLILVVLIYFIISRRRSELSVWKTGSCASIEFGSVITHIPSFSLFIALNIYNFVFYETIIFSILNMPKRSSAISFFRHYDK